MIIVCSSMLTVVCITPEYCTITHSGASFIPKASLVDVLWILGKQYLAWFELSTMMSHFSVWTLQQKYAYSKKAIYTAKNCTLFLIIIHYFLWLFWFGGHGNI